MKRTHERNLKKVGDRWYFDFSRKGADGLWKRYIRLGGNTKEEAILEMAKLRAKLAEGLTAGAVDIEDPLFEDFAREYLETYAKPRKRSWQRDEFSIGHLKEFIGRRRLSQVSLLLIEKYKLARREVVSSGTVDREIACLKTMLQLAIDWEKLASFPLHKVVLAREENTRERVLTADEEDRLLAAAVPHLRPLIVLALDTGMRRGEILKLRREHVNFTTGMITIPAENSKSKKERRVPMSPAIFDMLRPFAFTAGFIFGNVHGESLKTVHEAFAGACARAKKDPEDVKDPGIVDLIFHDLRHTFATRYIASGGNVVILSKILGHSSVNLTYARYCHPSDGDMLREVAMMAEKHERHERIDERMVATQPVSHSNRNH